jgi:glycosyltransferase involved in cell wall biosynthesis
VLVDRSDGEALAGALAALLRDPERRERLGAGARRHAEQTFDPARNARAVEAVYASILRS